MEWERTHGDMDALRAKVGLRWGNASRRETLVPAEASANSCFTLGKEVPKEVLDNTKNMSFRVARYGGVGERRREFHLLHEITLPAGSWRDEHVLRDMNFTYAPHVPPARLWQGHVWPSKADHKPYGKERAAVDGGRIVAYNRWRQWGGEFGKGSFRFPAPPPPPPPPP